MAGFIRISVRQGAAVPLKRRPDTMEIQYTGHARMRMIERAVSEGDAATVLSDPDVQYRDTDGNSNFVRFIDGRRIGVVIAAGWLAPHAADSSTARSMVAAAVPIGARARIGTYVLRFRGRFRARRDWLNANIAAARRAPCSAS
jgi:hypothetical protein